MAWYGPKKLILGERTSVSELAEQMQVPASAVVRVAFEKLGLLAVVTQMLTFDQASKIARAFGFTAQRSEP